LFGSEHLEAIEANAIDRQKVAAADGAEVGWIAGDHVLDMAFGLEKNIVNDTLQFALRVDTHKPPADLLRAYFQAELDAAAKENPSGFASARQRSEARATARERLEQEANDGRFRKRKAVPVMWDRMTGEVAVGSTSEAMLDWARNLFAATFDRKLERLTAGAMADSIAEGRGYGAAIADAKPAEEIVWVPDFATRDFLGNEFMLWLWYVLDSECDTIELADGSEVVGMFARSLTLECPRGQTGKESFRSNGPTRLPEARKAIQTGKLPRKAGLILVRHDKQYEFTLGAEMLTVAGAKLPAPEAEEERARMEERVANYREFCETLDLLYEAFLHLRGGLKWAAEAARLAAWVNGSRRAEVPA
jgi:hypothetical protein